MVGLPLAYPNPFSQSSSESAFLYYNLSKDMEIQIHVYNMLAQKVLQETFSEGANGARKGKNKLNISSMKFSESDVLSAGVYFFVFLHNEKVISKLKVAVKP